MAIGVDRCTLLVWVNHSGERREELREPHIPVTPPSVIKVPPSVEDLVSPHTTTGTSSYQRIDPRMFRQFGLVPR